MKTYLSNYLVSGYYPQPALRVYKLHVHGMGLPSTAIEFQGGCNCQAIRYKVSLPIFSERPSNPYRDPGADIGDLRLPMVAIDHCNDCRRATGSIIPMWLCAHLPTVSVKFTSRLDEAAGFDQDAWLPASTVFDPANGMDKTTFLAFYKSSEGRTRSFCGRCGTNISYCMDAGSIPTEWGWPETLDIPLGTIDRQHLEEEWFKPERQLWCEVGINWVRNLVAEEGKEMPAHPTFKINEHWKKDF